MTTASRLVLALVGAVLVAAAVYVERHRGHYDRGVQALSAVSFAGGVAAAALAALG